MTKGYYKASDIRKDGLLKLYKLKQREPKSRDIAPKKAEKETT